MSGIDSECGEVLLWDANGASRSDAFFGFACAEMSGLVEVGHDKWGLGVSFPRQV